MINITINTSTESISSDGFYRVLFICRATTQTRDSIVSSLQDCIDNGWLEDSEAYEFCKVAFSQQPRINEVVIRSMYSGEVVLDAIQLASFDCLYLTIEDIDDESKLQLSVFCKDSNYIYVTSSSVDITDLFTDNPNVIYIHKAEYDSTYTQDGSEFQVNLTLPTKQYPEAAWISRFGSQKPASILWLNKTLTNVVKSPNEGSPLSNYYWSVYDTLVAYGSGKTMSGEWIDNLVFSKWLAITLRLQVASLIIENDKIPFTTAGKQLLIHRVLSVLSIGSKLGGISSKYEVFVIEEQRTNRNIRIGFKAQLLGGINSVEDIQGTITA